MPPSVRVCSKLYMRHTCLILESMTQAIDSSDPVQNLMGIIHRRVNSLLLSRGAIQGAHNSALTMVLLYMLSFLRIQLQWGKIESICIHSRIPNVL